jgi:hypothetical protein
MGGLVADATPKPTRRQYGATRSVNAWYMRSYYGTTGDVGVAAMFCRRDRVGHFVIDHAALVAGSPDALFRLLVTMAMFQLRSDLQIMRVLCGIAHGDALELTDAVRLLSLADDSCELARTPDALLDQYDLGKCPETKRGVCGQRPRSACHLKRQTELLKRYGRFGEMPTSATLMLRAQAVADLPSLRALIWEQTADPYARALALEGSTSMSSTPACVDTIRASSSRRSTCS